MSPKKLKRIDGCQKAFGCKSTDKVVHFCPYRSRTEGDQSACECCDEHREQCEERS